MFDIIYATITNNSFLKKIIRSRDIAASVAATYRFHTGVLFSLISSLVLPEINLIYIRLLFLTQSLSVLLHYIQCLVRNHVITRSFFSNLLFVAFRVHYDLHA